MVNTLDHPTNGLQMSKYIDLGVYDIAERDHPFYEEAMIRVVELLKRSKLDQSEILELCAGTGIMTEKLAQAFPASKIIANEADRNCLDYLRKNMSQFVNTKFILGNASSKDFGEAFNIIVMSIGYHHLKKEDRPKFWENIKKHMASDSLLFLTDEFIPHFTSEEERIKNTKYAKQYIIDLCNKAGKYQTAALQKIFLDVNLFGVEEYKISTQLFEEDIKKAGFKIMDKEKVGPLDRDDVGGIFVYIIQKA